MRSNVLASGCGIPDWLLARSKTDCPVNFVLPSPSAALAYWTATPTRVLETMNVPGATLRGWTFTAEAQARQRLRIL